METILNSDNAALDSFVIGTALTTAFFLYFSEFTHWNSTLKWFSSNSLPTKPSSAQQLIDRVFAKCHPGSVECSHFHLHIHLTVPI